MKYKNNQSTNFPMRHAVNLGRILILSCLCSLAPIGSVPVERKDARASDPIELKPKLLSIGEAEGLLEAVQLVRWGCKLNASRKQKTHELIASLKEEIQSLGESPELIASLKKEIQSLIEERKIHPLSKHEVYRKIISKIIDSCKEDDFIAAIKNMFNQDFKMLDVVHDKHLGPHTDCNAFKPDQREFVNDFLAKSNIEPIEVWGIGRLVNRYTLCGEKDFWYICKSNHPSIYNELLKIVARWSTDRVRIGYLYGGNPKFSSDYKSLSTDEKFSSLRERFVEHFPGTYAFIVEDLKRIMSELGIPPDVIALDASKALQELPNIDELNQKIDDLIQQENINGFIEIVSANRKSYCISDTFKYLPIFFRNHPGVVAMAVNALYSLLQYAGPKITDHQKIKDANDRNRGTIYRHTALTILKEICNEEGLKYPDYIEI